jgi:hypothetical protein
VPEKDSPADPDTGRPTQGEEMSRREIRGFTVSVCGEKTDQEGYCRCNECNSRTMLVYPIGPWHMDSEAFKSGEEVEEREEIEVGEVTGHWCPKCELLISLSYNFG